MVVMHGPEPRCEILLEFCNCPLVAIDYSKIATAIYSIEYSPHTTAVVERSKTVPLLANLFKLPHLLLLSGGIVIKVFDEVVGAIGAAGAPGGDLDDACARAGLDKIKDQLK
jgi:uncharacterized protein GlcG (DUF336 family)